MAEASKPLVYGIILLTLIGGIIPLIMSSFIVDNTDYEGYLSPIVDIVKNGFSFKVPFTFGFGDLDFNPFKLFGGNFQTFLINQIQGFSLIPPIIGIPLLMITFAFLIYGIIKIFPIG